MVLWFAYCYNLIRSLPKQYSLFKLMINFNICLSFMINYIVACIIYGCLDCLNALSHLF